MHAKSVACPSHARVSNLTGVTREEAPEIGIQRGQTGQA